jgi:hypothetical protein
VVRRLGDLAERRDDGTITWVSRSHPEPDEPARYDLGVAHGVPGTIAALAAAVAADAEAALARELLEGSVAWVLSERRPEGWGAGEPFEGARLPFYLGSWDGGARPSRLAWCYGDAFTALMLVHAADALERDDWRAAALDLASGATRRDRGSVGIGGAGLCHGTAGLALVFARLAAAGERPELSAAASDWLGDTLELRKPGGGVGGFRPVTPGRQIVSFLTGATGIGLALLALSDDDPPTWDRLLLLAPPPR